MFATRTIWGDGSTTISQWIDRSYADAYAANMQRLGYEVKVWRL